MKGLQIQPQYTSKGYQSFGQVFLNSKWSVFKRSVTLKIKDTVIFQLKSLWLIYYDNFPDLLVFAFSSAKWDHLPIQPILTVKYRLEVILWCILLLLAEFPIMSMEKAKYCRKVEMFKCTKCNTLTEMSFINIYYSSKYLWMKNDIKTLSPSTYLSL